MNKKIIIKTIMLIFLVLLTTKNLCFAIENINSSEVDEHLKYSSENLIDVETKKQFIKPEQNSNKNQLLSTSYRKTVNKAEASMTDPFKNPDEFDPGKNPEVAGKDKIIGKASKVLGTIQVLGIVIAIIAITILGIKYMVGSAEEKAEYKKTMIPYIIGIVFLVSITSIVPIFADFVLNTIK